MFTKFHVLSVFYLHSPCHNAVCYCLIKRMLLYFTLLVIMFCSDLAIECFDKARRGRPLKPLRALKGFRVIYDGTAKCSSDGRGEKSPTRFGGQASHDRPTVSRSRSLSPMKDGVGAASSRDTTRGKAAAGTTTTTTVPKSTSMNASCQGSPSKKPLEASAGVRSDATAKQGPETASSTRLRQSRRAKEVGGSGGANSDAKDSGSPSADEATKTQRTVTGGQQVDSTRGGKTTTPTSTKSAAPRQAQGGTAKEQQSQKKKAAAGATVDSTDESSALPSRGS